MVSFERTLFLVFNTATYLSFSRVNMNRIPKHDIVVWSELKRSSAVVHISLEDKTSHPFHVARKLHDNFLEVSCILQVA